MQNRIDTNHLEIKKNMEHLSVQKRIKSIAAHFTACEYVFANWAQLNVVVDNIQRDRPTICYILPPSGTLQVKRGSSLFIDKPSTQIAFLVSSEHDFDGEENDELIESMKKLAKMFVKCLNDSGLFEEIEEEILYQVPYDTTDENVTGIVVTLPIVETGEVMCSIDGDFGYVESIEE